MASYFKFGDITIKVPEKMIIDDKHGNPLLKDTLTKSGNLSTYLGHKSIQIKDIVNLQRVKIVTDQPAYKEYVKPAVKKRGRKPNPLYSLPNTLFLKDFLQFFKKLNRKGLPYKNTGILYSGKPSLKFLIFLYLTKKYNLRHCYENFTKKSFFYYNLNIQPSKHYNENKRILECIKDLQGSTHDTAFFPFTIKSSRSGYHANLFIYKKITGEIIHYDPHGNTIAKKFIQALIKILNIINSNHNNIYFPSDLKLIESIDFCPIGLQRYENRSNAITYDDKEMGFCMMWTFLSLEIIMMKTKMIYSDIVNELTAYIDYYDEKPSKLTLINIIRGYIDHIYNELKPIIKEIYGVTINTNEEMYTFYGNEMNSPTNKKITADITGY